MFRETKDIGFDLEDLPAVDFGGKTGRKFPARIIIDSKYDNSEVRVVGLGGDETSKEAGNFALVFQDPEHVNRFIAAGKNKAISVTPEQFQKRAQDRVVVTENIETGKRKALYIPPGELDSLKINTGVVPSDERQGQTIQRLAEDWAVAQPDFLRTEAICERLLELHDTGAVPLSGRDKRKLKLKLLETRALMGINNGVLKVGFSLIPKPEDFDIDFRESGNKSKKGKKLNLYQGALEKVAGTRPVGDPVVSNMPVATEVAPVFEDRGGLESSGQEGRSISLAQKAVTVGGITMALLPMVATVKIESKQVDQIVDALTGKVISPEETVKVKKLLNDLFDGIPGCIVAPKDDSDVQAEEAESELVPGAGETAIAFEAEAVAAKEKGAVLIPVEDVSSFEGATGTTGLVYKIELPLGDEEFDLGLGTVILDQKTGEKIGGGGIWFNRGDEWEKVKREAFLLSKGDTEYSEDVMRIVAGFTEGPALVFDMSVDGTRVLKASAFDSLMEEYELKGEKSDLGGVKMASLVFLGSGGAMNAQTYLEEIGAVVNLPHDIASGLLKDVYQGIFMDESGNESKAIFGADGNVLLINEDGSWRAPISEATQEMLAEVEKEGGVLTVSVNDKEYSVELVWDLEKGENVIGEFEATDEMRRIDDQTLLVEGKLFGLESGELVEVAVPAEVVDQYGSYEIEVDGENVVAEGVFLKAVLENGEWGEVRPSQHTCFAPELIEAVKEQYLQRPEVQQLLAKPEYAGMKPWEAISLEFQNSDVVRSNDLYLDLATDYINSQAGGLREGEGRGRNYLDYNIISQIIGAVEIDLSERDGFENGDRVYCTYLASSLSELQGEPIPVIYGLKSKGRFYQAPYMNILNITTYIRDINLDGSNRASFAEDYVGETVFPHLIMRYDSLDHEAEGDERLPRHHPDAATPLLENPQGYIWRNYGKEKVSGGEERQEEMLMMMKQMDLSENGDIGFFATHLSFLIK